MLRVTIQIAALLLSMTAANGATKEYDLGSTNISGEIVRGPRKILAHRLNVLRYSYKFNSVASYSQAVDLWAKLTEIAAPPPIPAQSKPAALPPPALSPSTLTCPPTGVSNPLIVQHICRALELEAQVSDRTNNIQSLTDQVSQDYTKFRDLAISANTGTAFVRAAGKALASFLTTTTGDPAPTLAGIAVQLREGVGTDSTFISGTKAAWPDIDDIAALASDASANQVQLDQEANLYPAFSTDRVAAISVAQRDLQADDAAASDPAIKAVIAAALAKLQDLIAALNQAARSLSSASSQNAKIAAGLPDVQQSGQKYGDFVAARDQLLEWKTRMESLKSRRDAFDAAPTNNRDPFSLDAEANCEFAFSRTKTTAITLTRIDQMPGTTATNPETVLSISVECTSPFTVSAGVAFSKLPEREFGIQPVATPQGSTTTANQFVATTKSSFHPLPLGMIHVRLWEPAEWFALHGSFGVAGNIRSQSSGGSDAEFLIGPSISFFRTMFLTPGLHLGREVSLGAGFRENDPVPTNITTAPLQKSYRPAFGFAVTFSKP